MQSIKNVIIKQAVNQLVGGGKSSGSGGHHDAMKIQQLLSLLFKQKRSGAGGITPDYVMTIARQLFGPTLGEARAREIGTQAWSVASKMLGGQRHGAML
jgi:hypothetical protein